MIILGLGCNIGDRLTNLRQALQFLSQIPELTIREVAPVYQSDALLTPDAPSIWNQPFLNTALRCTATLNPHQLLAKLKTIEATMGRASTAKWSPRIIDIDILAWDNLAVHDKKISIPHPELINRPFALWPLADLAPSWQFCLSSSPFYGTPAAILAKKWGSRFTGDAPLHTQQIAHRIDIPVLMGILNITPDSFSDGGNFIQAAAAKEQAQLLFASGADIIDIGAESTRPNAALLTPDAEWQRLEPVLQALQELWNGATFRPKISIDTRHPETATKALKYEIDFLNDVTGFTNPSMLVVAKNCSAKLIFMHNLGIPANPKITVPENEDVLNIVLAWAEQQLEVFTTNNIDNSRLIFDVGIGFGKTADQSLELIKKIRKFFRLDMAILVGHSRKSFLGKFTAKPAIERDLETAIISNFLAGQKVDYLRIHNVEYTQRALKVNAALLGVKS